ncbi:MAG: energy-coupling factor transporter transmembrane protein EcfT [Erysipelotrichaceae bacterium]|nr:energy-coupling factor transporter transmembrane protein EcfT [Erysipelotrichaceae bacterium]
MYKLLNAMLAMNNIESISHKNTIIHQWHPLFKIICTFIMIICIISTYQLLELIIYTLMIIITSLLAHISIQKLITRGLLGLPFSLCLGVSFLIFDHKIISFYGLMIYEGILLLILVLLKTTLCLMTSYILIATTPFDQITGELIHIKIPSTFVLSLTMTYRYIYSLLYDAKTMSASYLLKNPQVKGIDLKDMGSFVGHLLVNSFNKSQHVYECMLCRGYNIETSYQRYEKFDIDNIFLLMMFMSFMIIVKVMV